jgi:hypothetical protein
MHLFCDALLTRFQTLTDVITIAPGYEMAMRWGLAELLMPIFPVAAGASMEVRAPRAAIRRAGRGMIKRTNMNPQQTARFDPMLNTGRAKDAGWILTGGFYDDPGFVGAAYQAASLTQDAQDLVNWYPEIDMTKQPGERGVIALYPTPGFFAKLALFLNVEIAAFACARAANSSTSWAATLYETNSTFTVTTLVGSLGRPPGLSPSPTTARRSTSPTA